MAPMKVSTSLPEDGSRWFPHHAGTYLQH